MLLNAYWDVLLKEDRLDSVGNTDLKLYVKSRDDFIARNEAKVWILYTR